MPRRKKEEKPKKEVIARLKGELESLRDEIKADVLVPVVASFGFIIALIWRDAIQSTINEYLQKAGLVEGIYIYQLISAVIVTIVVIVIMVVVTKLGQKRRRRKIRKAIEKKIEKVEKKIEKVEKKI